MKSKAQEPTWTGHGRISCYSHIETDVSFGEGAENGGEGSVTCRPEEWNGVFSPEAMFFSEDQTGEEFQIWAVRYYSTLACLIIV